MEQKHYLGDVKWVLYQYICDLQEKYPHSAINIDCGKFARDKMMNMAGMSISHKASSSYAELYLNGEEVSVKPNNDINKKQININAISNENGTDIVETITLYFA